MSVDINAIRERIAAATPGPWENDCPEVGQHWSRPQPWKAVVNAEVDCLSFCYGGSARPIEHEPDAELIAHAPTDLADLCDEVERLHSWAGLMELLDEHYPADIFGADPDNEHRDPGPRIVSLIRALNRTKAERDEARAQVERVEALIHEWERQADEWADADPCTLADIHTAARAEAGLRKNAYALRNALRGRAEAAAVIKGEELPNG